MKPIVMVTGATGFIGSALCSKLTNSGFNLVKAVRTGCASDGVVVVGDIDGNTDWSDALQGVDTVIHCAARVHIMRADRENSLQAFRRVNTEGSLNLGRQAAKAGVRRFIYLSSIKVNGEETSAGQRFTTEQAPAPIDPYGISKREAEDALREIARSSGMEVVIIRPPLVYGPGVKGNFQTMMQWLAKGIPLPFASIKNKRSLVALDNLIDLIMICIHHPAAVNQTFLVSDDEDLSTPELLKKAAFALGKTVWLMPFPIWMLYLVASMLGRHSDMRKLCESLQVDITKTRALLNWEPPIKMDQALCQTA
ncbi:MAG: UDP-glucose 4-epimerase family protein, partial [Gammaproteobacteria bacterium]